MIKRLIAVFIVLFWVCLATAMAKIWAQPEDLVNTCEVILLGDLRPLEQDSVVVTVKEVWVGEYSPESVQKSQRGKNGSIELRQDANMNLLRVSNQAVLCLWRGHERLYHYLEAWSAIPIREGSSYYGEDSETPRPVSVESLRKKVRALASPSLTPPPTCELPPN